MNIPLIEIIILNVFNVIDIIETYIAVHIWGLEEHNLFLKGLIENNYLLAVIIKLMVVASLSLFLYTQIKKNKAHISKVYHFSLTLVLIIYFVAIIGNFIMLLIYL